MLHVANGIPSAPHTLESPQAQVAADGRRHADIPATRPRVYTVVGDVPLRLGVLYAVSSTALLVDNPVAMPGGSRLALVVERRVHPASCEPVHHAAVREQLANDVVFLR